MRYYNLGIDMLHGGLNVGDAGRSHRDAARREDLEGRLRVLELVCYPGVQLRLVASLL